MKKLAVSIISGLMMSGLLVIATSTPAQAGTCSKSQAGDTRRVWGKVTHKWVMSDSRRVEVARGTSYSFAVKWSKTTTKQNSVKLSAEMTTSVKAGIFGGAEVKVGGEYGHQSTKSTHYEQTETWTVSKPGAYIIARGYEFFSVPVYLQRCRRPHIGAGPNEYAWMNYTTGTVKGWDEVAASTRCGDTYPPGFRRFVKAQRC